MKQQKNSNLLSMEEAAKRLGLSKNTLRVYARTERIKPAKNDGNGTFFAREDIEEYAKKRMPYPFNTKPGDRTVHPEPAKPDETAQRDDTHTLQAVLSTAISFLSAHKLTVSIQSLCEVKAESLRIWEVKTPACSLCVVSDGREITVLSDAYQKELEETIQTLRSELREAQTKLKYLRDKPNNRILKEYAQPLSVFIDAREDGFFVYCLEFPFAAHESTEDEALAAFRRMLWAYRAWLQYHERELSAKMQEDYIKLDDLLVER